MFTKGSLTKPGKLRVTFELPAAIWADQVWLCGDFNQWHAHATPMIQDRATGAWRVTVELDVGRCYEFRYLIGDDDWITDCCGDATVPNAFGSRNSVVDLSSPTSTHQGSGDRVLPITSRPTSAGEGVEWTRLAKSG